MLSCSESDDEIYKIENLQNRKFTKSKNLQNRNNFVNIYTRRVGIFTPTWGGL